MQPRLREACHGSLPLPTEPSLHHGQTRDEPQLQDGRQYHPQAVLTHLGQVQDPDDHREQVREEPQHQSGQDQTRVLQDESTVEEIQLRGDCHSPCQQHEGSRETPSNSTRTNSDKDTEGGNTRGKVIDDNDTMEPTTAVKTLQITQQKVKKDLRQDHPSQGKLSTPGNMAFQPPETPWWRSPTTITIVLTQDL